MHKVGPEAEEGRFLNVEPERLRKNIRALKRRHAHFVSARELASDWPEHGVCLTFDDGYVSTLTHGLEVLLSEGVPATVFVVAGLVGDASRWDGDRACPIADWDTLRRAQESGLDFGSHTWSHAHLGELGHEKQLLEIKACDDRMRQEGIDPGSFCLPYGSFNGDTRHALETAGHKIGLGLEKRMAQPDDDRLCLPRIAVSFSDGPIGLLYKSQLKPKIKHARM
jgi:peptidoglycan/xylan/chitin deacetylase (PgdA/CDA1 family)